MVKNILHKEIYTREGTDFDSSFGQFSYVGAGLRLCLGENPEKTHKFQIINYMFVSWGGVIGVFYNPISSIIHFQRAVEIQEI